MNLAQIKRNPRAAAQGMTLGELRKLLQKFDYEYHDQNKPSVGDKVYDTLRDVHDERAKKPYARVGSKSTHVARRTKLAVAMGSLSKLKPGSSGLLHVFTHSSRFYGVSLPGIGCPDAKMTSIRHTDALPEHGSGGRALEGASRAQGMLRIPCQLFSAAP